LLPIDPAPSWNEFFVLERICENSFVRLADEQRQKSIMQIRGAAEGAVPTEMKRKDRPDGNRSLVTVNVS
jgi:hypothetical protein